MTIPVVIKVRLYPGRDDDLIQWLSTDHTRWGDRSQLVRGLLRAACTQTETVNLENQSDDLLFSIRQILEDVLDEKIIAPGISVSVQQPTSREGQEADHEMNEAYETLLENIQDGVLLE